MQSDTGLTGGVSTYISFLVKSNEFKTFNNFIVVPGLIGNERVAEDLYGKYTKIGFYKKYSFWSLPIVLFKLKKIVSVNKIDMIHAHALRSAFIGVIFSVLYNIPLIYTNHGVRYKQKKGYFETKLFMFLEKFVCLLSNKVICIRKSDFRVLCNDHVVTSNKLTLVRTRNNILVKNFFKEASNFLTVISVGSIIRIKRPFLFCHWIDSLIKSGVKVNAFWIGDGILKDELQHYIKKNNLPINLPGHLTKSQLEKYYRLSDLFFLTSEFEVFPFVALEAAAYGIPIISSRFFGVDDFIINNKTGIILNKSLETNPSIKIKSLFEDKCKLNKMRIEAKKNYKHNFFNAELMAKDYSRIYLDFFRS